LLRSSPLVLSGSNPGAANGPVRRPGKGNDMEEKKSEEVPELKTVQGLVTKGQRGPGGSGAKGGEC